MKSSFLVVSVTSDCLYPPYQSEEIVNALTANDIEVQYCEIQSKLAGIVSSWDIAKAVALGYQNLEQIISLHVFTVTPEESITKVAKLMEEKVISALPVVNIKRQFVGIISSDSLSTLLGRCTKPKKHTG